MTSNGNLSYELGLGRIDDVTLHQYGTVNPMLKRFFKVTVYKPVL